MFRTFFDDALAQGGALAMIETASGRMIGSSRFQAHDPANGGSVEIGWTFLSREYWGGGFNAEMKRLMLAHALDNVARVDFRAGEDNWRSRKAMEKIGGHLTDRTQTVDVEGQRIVHLVFEVTRDSFAQGPLARVA